MTATDQGVRALEQFMRELYEATRGITAAYVIDTGNAEDAITGARAWDDLTQHQRKVFVGRAYPVFRILSNALIATTTTGGDPT